MIYCPRCDRMYTTKKEMLTHLKGQHPDFDIDDWEEADNG